MSATAGGLAPEEAIRQRREQLFQDARYQEMKLKAAQRYLERMTIISRALQRYGDSLDALFEEPPVDVESSLADFANEMRCELRLGDFTLEIIVPKPDSDAPHHRYCYRISKFKKANDDAGLGPIELGRVYEPTFDQIMMALSFMEDMSQPDQVCNN